MWKYSANNSFPKNLILDKVYQLSISIAWRHNSYNIDTYQVTLIDILELFGQASLSSPSGILSCNLWSRFTGPELDG